MVEKCQKQPANEENLILTQALGAFEETTGTAVTVIKTEVRRSMGIADAEIRLENGQRLLAEVKRHLTPATLGAAVAQVAGLGKPGMLVTRYITPPMAERLKDLDVAFMDTAGNAYLHTPKHFIYIVGRKPPTPTQRERPVRALRATGLKVIFAFLVRADLLNAPYRDIAQAADVALGTIGIVFNDLKRLGYLMETKAKGRVLQDHHGLINKWVEAYAHELRPRLKPQRYRVAEADWWKQADLADLEMWLGGEPAAAVLTKHLRPEIVTVYGDTCFTTLARRIKPAKDAYGNLEVLPRFWAFDLPQFDKKYPLVPPLLIYADLVASGDARNLETAQLIRERFLDHD